MLNARWEDSLSPSRFSDSATSFKISNSPSLTGKFTARMANGDARIGESISDAFEPRSSRASA